MRRRTVPRPTSAREPRARRLVRTLVASARLGNSPVCRWTPQTVARVSDAGGGPHDDGGMEAPAHGTLRISATLVRAEAASRPAPRTWSPRAARRQPDDVEHRAHPLGRRRPSAGTRQPSVALDCRATERAPN